MKPLEVLEPKPETEKIDLTSPDLTSGCTRSSIFCICVWVKSRLTVGGAETRIDDRGAILGRRQLLADASRRRTAPSRRTARR